jgi:hypothetical protein
MPTFTANFQLYKPDHGQTGWDSGMNGRLDTVDTKLASPMGAPNVVTSSSTPLFDLSKGHYHKLTMTMTASAPIVQNPRDGQPYKFVIKQDAVGGWSFTFPSSFKGAGVISTAQGNAAANKVNIQVFTWDATDSAFYPWGPMITL